MTGLVEWLVVASLRIALLAVPIMTTVWCLRRRGPGTHSRIGRVALLGFLACAALPTSLGGDLPGLHSGGAFRVDLARERELSDAGSGRRVSGPVGKVHGPRDGHVQGGTATARLPRVERKRELTTWVPLVFWGWLAGSLLAASRLLVGAWQLRGTVRAGKAVVDPAWVEDLRVQCLRLGVRRHVELTSVDWSGAPALIGLLRPRILLPESAETWGARQRLSVLTHELLHDFHGDLHMARLGTLLRGVFWFHPVVRIAVRYLLRSQELRCDRGAIQSGIESVDYAQCLVELACAASRTRPESLAIPYAGDLSLQERVRRVLTKEGDEGSPSSFGSVLSLTWVVPILACGWAVQTGAPTRAYSASGKPARIELGTGMRSIEVEVAGGFRVVTSAGPAHLTAIGGMPHEPQAWLDGVTWGLEDSLLHLREGGALPLSKVTGVLAVPPAVQLDIRVANGDLDARLPRVEGRNRFACGRGDVRIELDEGGSSGELAVMASLGNIGFRARDLASMEFDARAALGRVDVPADSPGSAALRVVLRSGRGSIRASAARLPSSGFR